MPRSPAIADKALRAMRVFVERMEAFPSCRGSGCSALEGQTVRQEKNGNKLNVLLVYRL
jgi:hypothetical protein